MNTAKNPPTDWSRKLSKPAVIDGMAVNDEELVEFLDWQLATGQKDFKLFRHLAKTGYLDANPVTGRMLSEAVNKRASAK